uniref:Ig-like domain-containing protein n=1 Tax=Zosterops lateralis melanops TaxID=1220523 RepID=A0A8D2NYB2_ZOSLA
MEGGKCVFSFLVSLDSCYHDHGLFLLSAAVTGQVTLEQHPREVTVREGNEITFECTMRGDDMKKYFMYWYRQGPRGALEWIYREGEEYGEGFKDRFVGSVESSRSTLQILAAKPRDAATYYCGAESPWNSSTSE